MALKIIRPNADAPLNYESAEKGDWLIHCTTTGGKVQFNKGGWLEFPADTIMAVYDTSIDVSTSVNATIMSLNTIPNIQLY